MTATSSAPQEGSVPALGADEQRLASIIRSANEGIITIDENQRIVLFNPAAERIFGYAAREVLGAPLEQLLPQRYRANHAGDVRQFGGERETERRMGDEQRNLSGLRKSGEEFALEASISHVTHDGHRFYTVMLRDITDRVRSQESLRASREEHRLLSANIQNMREQEQQRIARELHDGLGQALTALKMDVAVLEADLGDLGAASEPLLAQTRAMQHLLDQTVISLRRVVADLRPTLLDDLGLVPAVRWLLTQFSARYGIAADADIADHGEAFSPAAATALFRIVQEALTNVARHAQATRVHVAMRHEAGAYTLSIADNGQGMAADAEPAAARKSFGLLGIRERVRLLDGDVQVETRPGQGLTLRVSLPDTSVLADGTAT